MKALSRDEGKAMEISSARSSINPFWYVRKPYNDPNMVRTDFRIARCFRRRVLRDQLFAIGLAEYLKTQRLHPSEIIEWNEAISTGHTVGEALMQKIRLAFAEGILKEDLVTVDDDNFLGTCGQLIFRWIRNAYYGTEIVHTSPRLVTDSSKKQGVDYFEILGNPTDLSSLYFIFWEIKATDSDVKSRTDEIYAMHKNRTHRLVRGLELQLSLEYPLDKYPVLGQFVRHLLDHWLDNDSCKKLGGSVVFDTSHNPGAVFTTFSKQFPELHSAACRQVILIEVPKFWKMRKKLWNHLLTQMS